MKNQFTFKIHRTTGRYRSFDRSCMDIKLDGKQVGGVYEMDDNYEIRFIVKSGKHPGWKWVTLKKRATSFDEAKQFLRENFKSINEKLELVSL